MTAHNAVDGMHPYGVFTSHLPDTLRLLDAAIAPLLEACKPQSRAESTSRCRKIDASKHQQVHQPARNPRHEQAAK